MRESEPFDREGGLGHPEVGLIRSALGDGLGEGGEHHPAEQLQLSGGFGEVGREFCFGGFGGIEPLGERLAGGVDEG